MDLNYCDSQFYVQICQETRPDLISCLNHFKQSACFDHFEHLKLIFTLRSNSTAQIFHHLNSSFNCLLYLKEAFQLFYFEYSH